MELYFPNINFYALHFTTNTAFNSKIDASTEISPLATNERTVLAMLFLNYMYVIYLCQWFNFFTYSVVKNQFATVIQDNSQHTFTQISLIVEIPPPSFKF